jgi:hypothetical protein
VLGLTFGLVLASCLFLLVYTIPVTDELRAEMQDSESAELVLHFAPSLYDVAIDLVGGEHFFEMLDEHVGPAAEQLREQAAEAKERMSDVGH